MIADQEKGFPYFVALADLAVGFAAALAGDCRDARRARVRTRLAAFDRLRVFLRAFFFGMDEAP